MVWIRLIAGGAWRILRAVPWQVYVVACALLLIYVAYAAAVSRGDRQARRELAPLLMQAHADAATRLQQAADAEGRALAFDAGLQRCIGTRLTMDLLTNAVLTQRAKERDLAQRQLIATRKELANAYASVSDSCADQPVPAVVVGVLDRAAFGQAIPDTYPIGGDTGAAAGAGTGWADSANAYAAAAGAPFTAYADLSEWIAYGWAPALAACNTDKAAIRRLGEGK